ncbi:MAG: hemolysin family protein [Oscillospiraceae bacterium]|nr:hemolysin family protein [Oscillospiraceae bacterium]
MSTVYIALLAAALLLNAFFTMSEAAIVTLNDSKLRKLALTGNKKAVLISRLVEHPTRFYATTKIGGALAGFCAFTLALNILGPWLMLAFLAWYLPLFWAFVVSYLIAGVFCAGAILVLGDFVPRRLATRHHERFAFFAAGPLAAFTWLLRPLVALISATSGGILRLLGIDPGAEEESATEEEIRMLLDEGSEEGNIEESDKDMINNIFDFGDTEVSEMMIHRTEVVALEREADLREVVETAVESGCTRIPVYEGDLDNIVGILHVKDLLGLITRSPQLSFDISVYLRDPFYAVESMSCKLLFATLKEKKLQMAVVVDEYGGTAGIITMEDLVEGIVGDIQDEYDEEEEDEIAKSGADSYLIDGVADLEEVCKTLGLSPEEDELEEFETIGGYIIHKLGYIPGEEEQPALSVSGILFTVQQMEDHRIAKLTAQVLPKEDKAASSGSPEEKE